MVDYIVVGLGLAGTAFCETLRRNQRSFCVISDQSQTSSKVAAGLSNPVILKRFTLAWRADELVPYSKSFYTELEKELNVKFLIDQPILRKFSSIEEQNLWFEASDKDALNQFLSPQLERNSNKALIAPFDFGSLNGAYKLNTELFLTSYQNEILHPDIHIRETFDYSEIRKKQDYLEYKGIRARNILFAEGFGLKKNPFFNYLPMNGSKGEYLIIKSNELGLESAVKSSIFVIPLEPSFYLVGANYNSVDKDNEPSEEAKAELLKKLENIINCPYQVVGHVAGVRPTVKDRRPLIGTHPGNKMFHVLNGFGSHGVMIAPWAANELFNFLENGTDLDDEININRFQYLWSN
ncbi:NAD(P)/FAD-dependent oxidoreductase [Maribacter cobaltidurans]|uniref:FAD-dependent oxidoreductase n=1 Tax=Maribacter cobaltidurans TaxID=1178778 RepID=A0A223V5U9_9FLAO|nr:FAD-binding oxidoreductase [Maribacter cobaltidurans]ASV30686.1 FAD-dependent oxidoreductase [Maribacter cobaltidurans]GGD80933.1 FAD-dependent oxidoreductase [Maribacter cobaltidurans]